MFNKFNYKRRFLWLKQKKARKRFMFTHIPRKTVQRLKYTIGQPLIQAKGKNSVEHSLLLGCASSIRMCLKEFLLEAFLLTVCSQLEAFLLTLPHCAIPW